MCLYMGCSSCFKFVKIKWGHLNSLSDKDLNFKLVILVTLASASKAYTMQCLDICFQFMFGKLHKN